MYKVNRLCFFNEMDYLKLVDACRCGVVEPIQSFLNNPERIKNCAAHLFEQVFSSGSNAQHCKVIRWFVEQPWFLKFPLKTECIATHCNWNFILWVCQQKIKDDAPKFLNMFYNVVHANKITSTTQCEEFCKIKEICISSTFLTDLVDNPHISFRLELFEWFMTHMTFRKETKSATIVHYVTNNLDDLHMKFKICFSTGYISQFEKQCLHSIPKQWIDLTLLHTITHLFRFEMLYKIAPNIVQSNIKDLLQHTLHTNRLNLFRFLLPLANQTFFGILNCESFQVLKFAEVTTLADALNMCPLAEVDNPFFMSIKWNDCVEWTNSSPIQHVRKLFNCAADQLHECLHKLNLKIKTASASERLTLEAERANVVKQMQLFKKFNKKRNQWCTKVHSMFRKECVCIPFYTYFDQPTLLCLLQNKFLCTKAFFCEQFKNACACKDGNTVQWICTHVHFKIKHLRQGFIYAALSDNLRVSCETILKFLVDKVRLPTFQRFPALFEKHTFYQTQTLAEFKTFLSWMSTDQLTRKRQRKMLLAAMLANNLEIATFLYACNVRLTKFHWVTFVKQYFFTKCFNRHHQTFSKKVEPSMQWIIESLQSSNLPKTFWDQTIVESFQKKPMGAAFLSNCFRFQFISTVHTLLTSFSEIRKHLFQVDDQPFVCEFQKNLISQSWTVSVSNEQCTICYQVGNTLKHAACQHSYCDDCRVFLKHACLICNKHLYSGEHFVINLL